MSNASRKALRAAMPLVLMVAACSGEDDAGKTYTLPDVHDTKDGGLGKDAGGSDADMEAIADVADALVSDTLADLVDTTSELDAPDVSASADVALDVADVKVKDITDGGGFNYECKPLTIEACVTACGSSGLRKCLKEWGPCVPPQEDCGNCADDNCDGVVNEGCPPNPACTPVEKGCPVAIIDVTEAAKVGTGTTLHLSAASSYGKGTAKVVKWAWSVQAPAGAGDAFVPAADVEKPTYLVDSAGQYLFHLAVWDDAGTQSCLTAVKVITGEPNPPLPAEIGCADGTREGFLDQKTYPQIAACAGGWDKPGVTPDTVVPTCGNKGGNSGTKASGVGCSSADLCASNWHVCKGWEEVAKKSPTGCAGATPDDAKPKSLFFAVRQPSADFSKCGKWGDGFNDVFGCGNLGTSLVAEKSCGPLDRVLASMQPNSCGFNEAEPNLGPWECKGPGESDLNEGANVTKKACQGESCQYDGLPISPSDKGGVLCCAGVAP